MVAIRFDTESQAQAAKGKLAVKTRIINLGPHHILIIDGNPPKAWTDEAIEAARGA